MKYAQPELRVDLAAEKSIAGGGIGGHSKSPTTCVETGVNTSSAGAYEVDE